MNPHESPASRVRAAEHAPPDSETRPTRRDPSVLHDYLKMLAVGCGGLLVDFGLFNLLLRWGWSAVWANLVALVVAGLLTFKGNLDLTFGHRRIPDPHRAFFRFFVVTGLSVAMIEGGIAILALFDPSVLMLNLVKGGLTAIAVAAKFVAYREWVFRHVPEPTTSPADPPGLRP